MGDFDGVGTRYTLRERIASGRTTELFLATARGNHDFGKSVVIKRLLPELELDTAHRAVFAEEARLGARLVHAKVAQTIELGRSDNALYMAIEHVDGIDLIAVLRELALRERRLESHMAVWIVHELLDALDYAHNLSDNGTPLGIVHRDVSPGNIMLSKRGDVKLVDFGIARAYGPDTGGDRSRAPNGRTGYMSPEQVSMLATDARSDLFSAGIVLAELLTSHPLFTAATELDLLMMVRDVRLDQLDKHGLGIETGLLAIVRKALDRSVAGRWQTAAVFRDALGEWLFASRHRVTAQQIAALVAELRAPVTALARTATLPALSRLPSVSIPPRKLPSGQHRPITPGPPPSGGPASVGTGQVARGSSAPQKIVPTASDERPPRMSTRGKLHAARVAPLAPSGDGRRPAPVPSGARGRLGSGESRRLPAARDPRPEIELSDGAVDAPAAESISRAVSGFVDRPRAITR